MVSKELIEKSENELDKKKSPVPGVDPFSSAVFIRLASAVVLAKIKMTRAIDPPASLRTHTDKTEFEGWKLRVLRELYLFLLPTCQGSV